MDQPSPTAVRMAGLAAGAARAGWLAGSAAGADAGRAAADGRARPAAGPFVTERGLLGGQARRPPGRYWRGTRRSGLAGGTGPGSAMTMTIPTLYRNGQLSETSAALHVHPSPARRATAPPPVPASTWRRASAAWARVYSAAMDSRR